MEYLEYNCKLEEIPDQDSPEPGMVFIRKGFSQDSWVVAIWQGSTLGIIYNLANARKFAESL